MVSTSSPSVRRWRFPIAAKLLALLLAASLLPLGLSALVTVRHGLKTVESTAQANLQLVAQVTATRLDQLVVDLQRLQALTAADPAVREFCQAAPAQRPPLLALAQEQLDLLVQTNKDVASAFVTDQKGIGLVATSARNVGMDFNFRPHVRAALAGGDSISDLAVGQTSGEAGLYFAGPVRDAQRQVIGAMVIKLRGNAVYRICDEVAAHTPNGFAGIIDRNGIVLYHPDSKLLYRSLGRMSDEQRAKIDALGQYGVKEIESAGMDELMPPLAGLMQPGNVAFTNADQRRMVAGFAPMAHRPWIISVVQPREQFDQPLQELRRQEWFAVGALGLVAAGVAVLVARRLVRPIQEMTAASRRIAAGDWTARAPIHTHDEIADLGRTFNEMVPKLEERSRMEHALRLANEIQRHLLPGKGPLIPGLEVAGINIPADQTGGDYYDFLDLSIYSPRTLAVAVGDVTGHGIPAALLMATARGLLRARATPPGELAELMACVNRHLAEDVPDGRFMTLMYLVIDREARRLHLVSAGHDPVMLYDPAKDELRELEGEDIPLGLDRNWTFHEKVHENLPEGALLLIGTDGIWESRNPQDELFGKERLMEIIRRHRRDPAQLIVDAVTAALRDFRGDGPQLDDITVVAVRIIPEGDQPAVAGEEKP